MPSESIADIRFERLLQFLGRYSTDAEAAAVLGVAPGHLSQLKLRRRPGSKKGRDIGEKLARSMEKAAGLPNLWFDGVETASMPLSADEVTLVTRYRKLSAEARTAIQGWLAIESKSEPELPNITPPRDTK